MLHRIGPWYSSDAACEAHIPRTDDAQRAAAAQQGWENISQPPRLARLRARNVTAAHEHGGGHGRRVELRLRGEDANGVALPHGSPCVNFVRVLAVGNRTSGLPRALGQVQATPSAYIVRIWLPEHVDGREWDWTVQALLTWSNFDLHGWENIANRSLRDDTGCVSAPILQPDVLQLRLADWLQHAPLPSAATKARGAQQQPFSASSASPSHAPERHHEAPPCSRRDLTTGVLSASGLWAPASRCALPSATANKSRVRSIVGGKWVHFVGASTLLEVAIHLLAHATNRRDPWPSYQRYFDMGLLTDEVYGIASRTCARSNYHNRDWDVRSSNGSGIGAPPVRQAAADLLPAHTRVSMLYDGSHFACSSGVGLGSLVLDHGTQWGSRKQDDDVLGLWRALHGNASDAASPPELRPLPPRGDWLYSLLSAQNATPRWLHAMYGSHETYGDCGGAKRGCNQTCCHNLAAGRREEVRTLRDDGPSLGWPNGPDVVIVNSGVHDVGDRTFTLDRYASRLRRLWALLRAAVPPSRRSPPHYLWVSTGARYLTEMQALRHPSTGYCPVDVLGNKTYVREHYNPSPVFKRLNEIADALALENGADIVDQEQFRELDPFAGDTLHCLQGSVCHAQLDSLVRLMEMGPRADRPNGVAGNATSASI